MTRSVPSVGATRRPGRDWLSAAIGASLVVVVGVVLGLQYVSPDKRVLAVVAALLVLGVTLRLEMIPGIGLLLLALPYPRANVFGSTNLALILLLLIIWRLRVSAGAAPHGRSTPLDLPIVGLVIAYIVSFYNVEKADYLPYALANFVQFLACLTLFYIIVNNVQRGRDLERLHLFQAVTIAGACLLAVWELNHVGQSFIPGWIDFTGTYSQGIDLRDVRVGGPFFDFELLADYCAVNIVFVLFLLSQARTILRRVALTGLLSLVGFVQFATVTRGALIALALGLVYLAWLLRRQLHFVQLTIASAITVVSLFAMNFYVSTYTHSGDLFKRLLDPQTVKLKDGLPVGRAATWTQAFNRMLEHPIIGHGPYYSLQRGLSFWYWPHNVYLYIGNLVGIVGLSFFLWMMWRMWRLSTPRIRDVRGADYATAYLVFAHAQLFVFAVDQLKIDYLRNQIYQFQVWVMFAFLVAAARVRQDDAGRTELEVAA